jgi:DNA polymerase III subunit gamma/tau
MYQALYRSYRPETFDTLLGQEPIVKILRNQINTQTTGHAYLFCGTRGTGKTSTARLLAKALNCLAPQGARPCGECAACRDVAAGTFVDVVEIDAASNNGVDNIRELRESVNYPPALGRTKVYIIDEAHMLSSSAANALLKTLEEPPSDIVFILATTEPHRLPATIVSRCIRLDFRRVSEAQIKQRFKEICSELGVQAAEDALAFIAANADGSVRDGLSLLDRCISGSKSITREDVLSLLGMSGEEVYIEITDHVLKGDVGEALLAFHEVLSDGKEVNQFAKDWVEHFRSLMMIKFVKNPENVLNLSKESIERLKSQAKGVGIGEIKRCIVELSKALADAKWSPRPRVLIELAIVKMASQEETPAERTHPSETKDPPVPAAVQPKAQPAAELRQVSSGDQASLWTELLADEKIPNMLRTCGSVLKEITDKIFIIEVRNTVQEDQFKKEKVLLENLVEGKTGKRLHMELAVRAAEIQESFI